MEGALAWISEIFQWIGQFIPRWEIVPTTHGAVKFVWGKKVIPLGPGWHVFWPLSTKFESYPTVRQTTNLRAQTLVTKDNKTIIASGLVVYRIYDIEAILARTYEPDETIEEIALGAINHVISGKTWDALKEEHADGRLDKEMRKRVRALLRTYGVHVLKASLTDLAPCKVLKLVTDSPLKAGQ